MPTWDPDAQRRDPAAIPDDVPNMPFGKYKGWPLTSIPESDYVDWLANEADIQKDWLRTAVRAEHQRRLAGGLLTPAPSPDQIARGGPRNGSRPTSPPAPTDPPLRPEVYRWAEKIIKHGTALLLDDATEVIQEGEAQSDLTRQIQVASSELAKMLARRGKDETPVVSSGGDDDGVPF